MSKRMSLKKFILIIEMSLLLFVCGTRANDDNLICGFVEGFGNLYDDIWFKFVYICV